MKKIIPIVTSIEREEEIPIVCVLLQSILNWANSDDFCDCTILTQQRFLKLSNDLFASFQTKNMQVKCLNLATISSIKIPYYSKLYPFIPKLFPQYEKVLYLDVNTLVCGKFSHLFEIDLDRHLLAGVPDKGYLKYKEFDSVITQKFYVNDGVLLFNISECKKNHFTEIFFENFSTQNKNFPCQDTLNDILEGKIKILPYTYNYQQYWIGYSENTTALFDENVCILNYSYYKPYLRPELELMDLWWDEARKTHICYKALLKQFRTPVSDKIPIYKTLLRQSENSNSDKIFSLMKIYLKEVLPWIFSMGLKRKIRRKKLQKLYHEIQERITL